LVLNIAAILKILLYTGIFSHLLPLVFFLLFKLDNKEKLLRVILFYILYCVANEGINFYLQLTENPDFHILFSFFTIVEYSFFCYFFYLVLPKNSIKKIVPVIWLAFVLFAVIDFFFFNEMNAFDSFTSGIESLIIILFCIYYLFIQIKGSNSLLIYSTFNFWIIIAFLIYSSGTFLLYLIANSLKEDENFLKLYFIINISFNILKNILLSIAMTMKTTDSKQLTPSFPDLDDDVFFRHKN